MRSRTSRFISIATATLLGVLGAGLWSASPASAISLTRFVAPTGTDTEKHTPSESGSGQESGAMRAGHVVEHAAS